VGRESQCIQRIGIMRKANSAARRNRSADAVEADLWGFFEGVMPDADNFSSPTAELVVDALVAGHVLLAIFIPESAVVFRTPVALGQPRRNQPSTKMATFTLAKQSPGFSPK
jgi:hypothetical protein